MGLPSVPRFPHTSLEKWVFYLCSIRMVSYLLRQVPLGAISHMNSLPKYPSLLLQLKPFGENQARLTMLLSIIFMMQADHGQGHPAWDFNLVNLCSMTLSWVYQKNVSTLFLSWTMTLNRVLENYISQLGMLRLYPACVNMHKLPE